MKKLEEYHWICPEPFTNVFTTTLGIQIPCCVMYDNSDMLKFFKEEELYYSAEDKSHSDFWHSAPMKRLREAMKNGGDDEFLDSFCDICKSQEKSGNRSYRQFYISRFKDGNSYAHKKEELEKIIATDSYPTFHHSAEMNHRIGNVCNLACNMCNGLSSSTIDKEAIKLGEKTERERTLVKTKNKFDEDFEDIVNKTVELKFTGGEPLIGNRIYETMSLAKNPEEKTIRIITNATKPVDRFIQESKKFKSVVVNISVEGIGDLNSYIRYPSNWENIISNIEKLMYHAPHIKVYITPTINAINAGRVYEICEYFGNDVLTNGSYVGNNFYSINSIPEDVKNVYLDKLYQYGKYDLVKTVIKYLEKSEYSEYDMYAMLSHIKRRDEHRKTNLLDHVPEWKKHYENCISY